MGLVIGLFLAEIVFFLGFLFFSKTNYNRRFKTKYDLRNTFPYELNYEATFKDNFAGNVCYVLMCIINVGIYALSMDTLVQGTLAFNLVGAIITTISLILVLFVPLKLLKTHLLCSTALIIGVFLSFAAIGYTSLDFYNILSYDIFLITCILGFAFAIFMVGLIMNPKLTTWAKAEKVEVDGQVIYKRPKYIVLAFSEWLSIILTLVAGLLQTLLVIFLNI